MNGIKVYVVEFGDRGVYQLQWKDPNTGRKKTKTTGIKITGKAKDRAEAERKAAALESLLCSNYSAASRDVTWESFRERYEREVCGGLAKTTLAKVVAVFNAVEDRLNPSRLSQMTEERISYFVSALREAKKSEATIKSTLAHLKAALRWAKRMKLIVAAPEITMPSRAADKGKGRPITGEEFDRMIEAVPKVVDAEDVADWRRLLRGLWLSGLRLGEALNLWWDRDDRIAIDFAGRRPMLRIPASMEKGHRDRMLPITPDFAEFLLATPEGDRRGRVFRIASRVKGRFLELHRVSVVLSRIGAAAGVKVATKQPAKKGDAPQVKFASAHDLRRSFGERWAARVMPQVLMELMRHEDISTTMRFYVGRNAERTADAVWAAFGNSLANTPNDATRNQETKTADAVKESAENA